MVTRLNDRGKKMNGPSIRCQLFSVQLKCMSENVCTKLVSRFVRLHLAAAAAAAAAEFSTVK